ncbi:MAG TPA: trypsin-like peptidase domain-containing protein [Nitrososphaeraceae archaeon]|nr:trypsin-like peptidase domain-containing protein [Nitrososphaeraceae archaeon]
MKQPLLLCCSSANYLLVICCISMVAVLLFSNSSNLHNVDAQAQEQKVQQHTLSLNDIFNKVERSVVQITRSAPPPVNILIPESQENTTALGSGFVYDNNGHIVTNYHVIANASIVDVTFIDGNRYTANVTGIDPSNDLAVLKIIENFTAGVPPPPLVLGNSSQLKVGDQVVAIGNPFGLEGSMTTGIVSQTGRLLPEQQQGGYSIPDTVQTDASINPGNSGGPLLNMNAEVIGVNTAGIFPGGIGFAISSNSVSRIVPILIEKGNYTHPWLGLSAGTLTSDVAKREGLQRSVKGIIVDSIVKNGPADKAGINGSTTNQYGERIGGDIITAVDGNPIIRMEDLISYLEIQKSPGENMTLTVLKDGKTIDKQITIGQRPSVSPYLTNAPQQPYP